ncbi:MAG TPA: type II toxin-antitoxin system HicB family antitoxin [Stellaceae bacterium]|jgi:predicted RNase H-like HicB family nuclease|nr:type II toxin-antitoxin system HicB family antitoxin [Stellaceae bacterium]
MTRVYFPAIVEGGRRPGYSVFFPDLPGLASAGDSVQAAALNAEEALRGHIALLAEEGHEIPGARALDAIERDPEVREVARILVGVDVPSTRALRINVSLPEDLVRRIDAAADNRSRFLAQAAAKALQSAAATRSRPKSKRRARQ